MKRNASQYSNLAGWWDEYRAANPGPGLDVLEAALASLSDATGDLEVGTDAISRCHLPQTLDVLCELGADPECLALMCRYFALRAGGAAPEPGSPAGALVEIDRLERAYRADSGSPEGLRRLLLAIVEDVRVVLVVLADRLIRLRALVPTQNPERRDLAALIRAIHVPLANRLGIWQLKWELEDLVFRVLEPALYQRIARLLDERRADRERYIARLIASLNRELSAAGLKGEVGGRPKHIYSIWRKMQRKGLAFHELYDIRAVRILVDDVATCYAALGLVHTLWPPIPGEFDDYVANPKGNQYRSLHTAVFGPDSKTVEIQIRTWEMNDQAELGVAPHWRYKEGAAHDPSHQRKLAGMRQLLAAGGEAGDAALLDEFGAERGDDTVYVLTPKGRVVELKAGCTVLDFAYHIHTDIGHRCKGAKVNGHIVPLTYQVKNGEQIEILTAKHPDPSRDWLVTRDRYYLHSARARAKVRQWFRQQDRERNLADGKELLERELKRLAASAGDLEPIVKRFKLNGLDALYVAVAIGEISVGQVAAALEELRRPDDPDLLPLARSPVKRRRGQTDDLIIEGVGNLMTNLARCCNPVPGDAILGFVTRGRGVSIHRRDCKNVDRLIGNDPARMLEVEWGGATGDRYQAEIALSAFDRKGLIRDIGNLLANSRSDVLSLNSNADGGGHADIRLTVRVSDFDHLSYLINRLATLPNVLDVRRVG